MMETIVAIGEKLGLQGGDLRKFIEEQQAREREERALEREEKAKERENEREAKERENEREAREREVQRQYELELKKLELEAQSHQSSQSVHSPRDPNSMSKMPKIPCFVDNKDNIDSYLLRFERFAGINNWNKTTWATSLSALLTGRALDVYSRLSDADATNYDKVKDSLLKRYELTENGFSVRFRNSEPESGESAEQYITRLQNYLTRWIELSNTDKTYDSLFDLMIKEQFLNSCSPDLSTFLKERAPVTLAELSTLTDQYLTAHKKSFANKTFKHVNKFESNNKFKGFKGTSNLHLKSSNAGRNPYLNCVFCCEPHAPESCGRVLKMDIKTRKQKVKDANRCYLCLKPSKHFAKECRSGKKCSKCKGHHHNLLCDPVASDTTNSTTMQSSALCAPNNRVLLMTASVVIKGSKGDKVARLLIDGGSQRSYIRNQLANSVGVSKIGSENLCLHSFGENSIRVKFDLVQTLLVSRVGDDSVPVNLLATDKLCAPLETIPSGSWVDELFQHGFILSDKVSDHSCPETIDIIIGSDYIWDILTHNTYTTSSGLVATESKFGWVLQGKVDAYSPQQTMHNSITLFTSSIPTLWDLETVGITNSEEVGDHPTFKKFERQIERKKDGRYCVPLMWKENTSSLESNYNSAKQRLDRLENRLQKDSSLKTQYEAVFSDYIAQDIIEEVTINKDDKYKQTFYLPHHAVVKQSSESTKLRPVFDGSAKDPSGISLNNQLDPGPSLLPLLVDILIRFRSSEIAFTGDISKAFLQLILDPNDRDFLRFLWQGKVFRFKRVCFGISCAPFLLNATIRHHLLTHGDKQLANKMLQNFYVDDLLMCSTNVQEAFNEILQSVKIMNEAKMPLQKWKTNSFALKSKLLDSDICCSSEGSSETKVLGIPWNTETDSIGVNFPILSSETKLSKRRILSIANGIFDPLGFASPITISFKCLLRRIWLKGYDWDENLSEEDQKWAKEIYSSFDQVTTLSVPRYYFRFSSDKIASIHLHLFTDSSEEAYAACIYVTCSLNSGESHSNLVIAKTRLSPIKKLTLPRLELTACCIGSKLLSRVRFALNFTDESVVGIHCWTDSMIALHWIQSSSLKYKPFVSNRIQDIQSVTPPSNWNHCPGTENPADQATRPIVYSQWNQSFWLEGPSWLRKDASCWPSQNKDKKELGIDNDIETKSTVPALVTQVTTDPVLDLSRFSKLSKALKVFSYVQRAIVKFKKSISLVNDSQKNFDTTGKISVLEIQDSLNKLIQLEQNKFYSNEIEHLKSNKTVYNSKLKNLVLKFDSNFLFSVGRISNDLLIILPAHSDLTNLIVLDCHHKTLHSGISSTLAELRQKYWIIQPRRTVKSVIRKCFVCRLHHTKSYQQQESILSTVRTNEATPFSITGCDHAGPFYTNDCKKHYLLIFTCTVVRAVYLELSPDLQTENFLLAFRRFQARCGTIKIMLSDNSTTFRKASLALKEYIDWKFIPEYSPTWGGIWERLIKSAKLAFRKCLGRQVVSAEVLKTLLTEIESCINHRPITYVSDDPNDPQPLRPIDFVRNSSVVPMKDQHNLLVKSYKERNHHLSILWKRWKLEYLSALRSWNKSKKSGGSLLPKVNDIVLVDPKSVSLKNRALWPLGRITSVIPGKDGFPRYVTLISRGKILRRNSGLIYPLETNS